MFYTMKKIFAAIALTFTMTGCLKDNNYMPETAQVLYKQTYGSDPWGKADTDNNSLLDVSNYMTAQRISVYSISIDSVEAPQGCYQPACKTGKIFTVTAPLDQRTNLMKLGFN